MGHRIKSPLSCAWLFTVAVLSARSGETAELIGAILDAESGAPLAARVYLRDVQGDWRFCTPTSPQGSAVAYQEQWVPMPGSVDRHTTVSAHPFRFQLPAGRYELTIERGKEYHPFVQTLQIEEGTQHVTVRLRRWIDMAARGWYSGETHVHRRIEELPNVMLAEDLNVAFPVTFWTTEAFAIPGLEPSKLRRQGPSPFGPRLDRGWEPIVVDSRHVIFPRNTEYEIFSVAGQPHVLGAIFVLNHRHPFRQGMPPVAELAAQAHRDGALLDLDKHNWPWSLMLVPIARVDLFELANNSVWRTEFGFRQTQVPPADYMRVETDSQGLTEKGWLDFGFETYYSLLNCGFRLQPTAGTASGVHPVPLGFGRVYVQTNEFSGSAWIEGLRAGRSFVTTGPMLLATVADQPPGHVFEQAERRQLYSIEVEVVSARPIERIEVIQHGRVIGTQLGSEAVRSSASTDASMTRFQMPLPVEESTWVCIRAFERQDDGRLRFAHTAPWHFEVCDQVIRPRLAEVNYLIERMERELQRNRSVLPEAALSEFEQALQVYQSIAARAR